MSCLKSNMTCGLPSPWSDNAQQQLMCPQKIPSAWKEFLEICRTSQLAYMFGGCH